ncbi:MAG: IPTL-CTERM sorting domain-containing protein [Planctomycetota bacterium]
MTIRFALIVGVVTAHLTPSASAEPRYGWTRTFGGQNPENCESVAVAPNGSVYVVGAFNGSVEFDPTDGQDIRQSSYTDFFVTKLNGDGSYGWTHTYWADDDQSAAAVVADRDGNIFVAGTFEDFVDFDPTPGVDVQGAYGSHAPWLFITKLKDDESYGWTRSVGFGVFPSNIAVAPDGSVAVTGTFQGGGPVDFDPSSVVDNHVASGAQDVFVTKLYNDGNYAWTRTFGSASQFANEGGLGLTIDKDGAVIVTGRFRETVDFNPSDGIDLHTSNGDVDAFVTKLNADGSYAWTYTFGGNGYDSGNGVAADTQGNIYVTGAINGDVNPYVTKLNLQGQVVWSIAGVGGIRITVDRADYPVGIGGVTGDPMVFKRDPDGNGIWSAVINTDTPASATAYDLAIDGNDDVVLAGMFYESVDFDPWGEGDWHSAVGSRDIFVTKIVDSVAVPMLSEWGLISMTTLLVGAGIFTIARRVR